MSFFNTLYNFTTDPADGINKIMGGRNLIAALLGYFAGALSIMMVIGLESDGFGPAGFTFALLALLVFNLCVGFFFSSSAHLFLELTTGKSRAAGLFVLLGLSEFTKTLLVAFTMIFLAAPALESLRPWLVMLVLGLQVFVVLAMMQKAYGLSKTGTFFALAASFLPSLISMLTIGFLFIWFIIWLIFK